MNDTQKSARSASRTDTKAKGFTAEEKGAMRERAKELKAEAGRADAEGALLAKIAEMSDEDRAMAERIHAVITATAPELSPRTWYGMPAYSKDDKILCFFQAADKFKARYATFGFDQDAKLDEGSMWPTSWALTKLTTSDEATITALVKKAVG